MKGALKKIGFPLAIICALALQTVGMDLFKPAGDPGFGLVTAEKTAPDTILYEYLFGNLPEILEEDTVGLLFPLFDTVPQLTARDTLFPPDSLRESDLFRYKYYVALLDSLTHKLVVDSLRNSGDSLDWPRLDSLYYADSASRAKAAFDAWYAGLSKTERKKYDFEEKANRKQAVTDSILAVKDSLGAIRDSIREATPRILETFALTDSMQYKRIITWTHEREFHRMEVKELDTNYNYRFYDYPFFRKDVNAMAGRRRFRLAVLQLFQPEERERNILLRSLRILELLARDIAYVQLEDGLHRTGLFRYAFREEPEGIE